MAEFVSIMHVGDLIVVSTLFNNVRGQNLCLLYIHKHQGPVGQRNFVTGLN
jgi:hypothetical protein